MTRWRASPLDMLPRGYFCHPRTGGKASLAMLWSIVDTLGGVRYSEIGALGHPFLWLPALLITRLVQSLPGEG